MSELVSIRREGHVAEITFSAPPLNYATIPLLAALADALEALDGDAACRAIVLRSEGKAFCAGAQLGSGQYLGSDAPDPIRVFYDHALRIFACGKPIVAAVQGAAIGAGLGLAMAADFRVASPEARFAANFVKLGYHPGFALTCTLPRVIGDQRAGLMILTGRRIKPEEALQWGLVDEIAEPDGLRGAALALAAEVAENAPLSLVAARRTMRAGLQDQIAAALVEEKAQQEVLAETEDFAEGIRSVAERRAGQFHGR